MSSSRACTPPPQRPPSSLAVPSTPGPGCKRPATERSVIPPSPGPDAQVPTASASATVPILQAAPKTKERQQARGAGTVELPPKKRRTASRTAHNSHRKAALDQSFRFLDLPAEIRNMIYDYTCDKPCQALLVHRPRLATLRSRTRMDRSRTSASELSGREHDKALAFGKPRRSRNRKDDLHIIPRATNRPFFGLTQVCQSMRQEYRPIYMMNQEIGMDLTSITAYLETYYPQAPALLSRLGMPGEREAELPFSGNITIAVGDDVKNAEKSPDGVDVLPLLDIWANSFRVEAGFGRYVKEIYIPMQDGEAKDLYRLFGRRVKHDRNCTPMNQIWRAILRTRSLAAVRIHRAPPLLYLDGIGGYISQRPYLHFVFREEMAEPWMVELHSEIPNGWLFDRGFGGMEYFDVKVGILPSSNPKGSF